MRDSYAVRTIPDIASLIGATLAATLGEHLGGCRVCDDQPSYRDLIKELDRFQPAARRTLNAPIRTYRRGLRRHRPVTRRPPNETASLQLPYGATAKA